MRGALRLAAFAALTLAATAAAKPPADPIRPQSPKDLTVTQVTATSVTLAWPNAKGAAAYGVYRDGTRVQTTAETSVTVTGLACDHRYAFGVDAVDAAGNRSATQVTVAARTDRCPDTTPPTVPARLVVRDLTTTTVTLSWPEARDNVGVAGYGVYRDGALLQTIQGTSLTLTGLACDRSFSFAVDAVDAAGNRSAKKATTGAQTAKCPKPPDPARPQAPKELNVTQVTATAVALSWPAAKDNKGVVAYGVYRDGTLVLTTPSTSATVTGLDCEHNYSFGVDAVDAAGNRSAKQATAEARTGTCPDTTPPTTPTGLAVSASSDRSISVSWEASRDNVGVVAYALFLDGNPAGSTAATSTTFDNLLCGHAYTLGVTALDAAGNTSQRAELKASTIPCGADLFVARDGTDYRWSFVAAVYDGAAVRLYVNGALVSSQAVSGSIERSDGPLRIGGNSIWGEWFSGAIDNVRVYGRALSKEQLGADMLAPVSPASPAPATTGLVAAYGFDELAGNAVADASGRANNGVVNGAAWKAAGRFGSALTFDGVNDFVTVADSDSLDLSDAMTLEAWVQPSDLGSTWQTAILKEAGSHLAYALYPNAELMHPSAHVFVGADLRVVGPDSLPSNDCRAAAAPCASFDRAYHSATPGQIVQLGGGTYPMQLLLYDPAKEGASTHVVFRPAAGASVTIDGNLSAPEVRFMKGASHFTVRDVTVLGDVVLDGCGVPDGQQCPPDATAGSNDITLQNLRVKGGVAFLCHTCTNVQILGGVWGPDTYLPCHGSDHPEVSPAYDSATFVKLKRPNHILIDGARFQNFARCGDNDHTECLQFEPADFVTISNSYFTRCDTITLAFFTSLAGDSLSPAGFAAPDHIVLENNFIDQSYDAAGGPTYHALQIGACTNCVIRYNSWAQAAHMPCGPPCGDASLNNVVTGNVGPQTDCGNGGITFSHNVFQGTSCGPTDRDVANLGFVDAGAFDLHLRADSPAVDAGDPADFPAADIDDQHRPSGAAPDAGADER